MFSKSRQPQKSQSQALGDATPGDTNYASILEESFKELSFYYSNLVNTFSTNKLTQSGGLKYLSAEAALEIARISSVLVLESLKCQMIIEHFQQAHKDVKLGLDPTI